MKLSLRNILKNREFMGLLLVSALFLGYVFLTSFKSGQSSKNNITFPGLARQQILQNPGVEIVLDKNFSPPDIPKTLPAYTYNSTRIDLMRIASALANKFLKDPVIPLPGIWNDKDNSAYVSVSPEPHYLQYSVNYLHSTTLFDGPNLPSASGAAKATNDLLDLVGEMPEIIPVNTSYLIVDGPHFEEGSPSRYEIIKTEFSTGASGFPIYDPSYQLNSPVISLVGQKDTLVRITLQENLITPAAKGINYPLFKLEEIIENLRRGQIVSIDNFPDPIADFNKISKITVESIEIIYFPYEKNKFLIPAFKIVGLMTTNNREESRIKILLPANEELFPFKPSPAL